MTVNIFAALRPFRNLMVISQLEGDFVGEFATHFAAAKLGFEGAKWHTCAWRVFYSCKNFRNLALQLAKFFHRMTLFS